MKSICFAAVCVLLTFSARSNGSLTLTPSGIGDGFKLTTFASGFPTNSDAIGPLGVAFTSTGGVLVSDYLGNVRVFPTDTDGQSVSSVPAVQNYGIYNAKGIAQGGGRIYMTQGAANAVVQVNQDGTLNQTIASSLPNATGAIYDPITGHFYVTVFNSNLIDEIDPVSKAVTTFATTTTPDNLAISADGRTLYAAGNNHIVGFSTATRTLTYDSGANTVYSADGIVVGAGAFTGDIFTNTNDGRLVEISLATNAQTLIASGGSRGDALTFDPQNGTLLIDQTDSILRLGGTSVVPEPNVITCLGLCTGLLALLRRSRRRYSAAES